MSYAGDFADVAGLAVAAAATLVVAVAVVVVAAADAAAVDTVARTALLPAELAIVLRTCCELEPQGQNYSDWHLPPELTEEEDEVPELMLGYLFQEQTRCFLLQQ